MEALVTLGPAVATLLLGLATGRWANRTTKAELDVELMRLAKEMTLDAHEGRGTAQGQVDALVAIIRLVVDALDGDEATRAAAAKLARERMASVMGWNTGPLTSTNNNGESQ